MDSHLQLKRVALEGMTDVQKGRGCGVGGVWVESQVGGVRGGEVVGGVISEKNQKWVRRSQKWVRSGRSQKWEESSMGGRG